MSKKAAAALALGLLALSAMSGPAGAFVEDYQIVEASTGSDTSASKTVEAECPEGTELLGGGGFATGSSAGKALVASQALLDFGSGDAIGWAAEARTVFSQPGFWSLRARAICGHVPGLERVGDSTASDSNALKQLDLACPLGKLAISGGFEIEGASEGVTVYASTPSDDGESLTPVGWTIFAYETVPTSSNWSLRGQVLCADVDALLFSASTSSQSSDRPRSATLFCPAGYVAMGGGGRLGGFVVDWIHGSHPEYPGESWAVRYQRESGETASSSLTYRVVCPEPGAATQGLLALATLALWRRPRCGPGRR